MVASLKKALPGVPILSFNSSQNPTPEFGVTTTNTIQSLVTRSAPPTQGSRENGDCCRCGISAHAICKGCKYHPTGYDYEQILTRYCSTTCQREDWKVHKTFCKAAQARRLLYRAADLIKALFYIHHETTFTWAYFKRIEKRGRYRVVFLDMKKQSSRNTLLVPFSTVTDLVPDRWEQEAFLAHLACNEVIAKFGPVLTDMLKGT